MAPIAEAEPMSESTQETLFTLPADDHVRMIQELRDHREAIRSLIAKQLERRMEIARRLNEAKAVLDDMLDGIGRHPDADVARNQAYDAHQRLRRAEAEMVAAHERQRGLRAALLRAEADVEAAIGGVQRKVVELMLELDPVKCVTSKEMRTRRQKQTCDAAEVALRAMGGRASCVKLAAFLGLDPHGLPGLLVGDVRIVKTHDGRLNNLETVYELASKAAP